jgi:metal-sulfur cluster biosynthetic enzyme
MCLFMICADDFTVLSEIINFKRRLERCNLWSTLTFQRCPLRHVMGNDVIRAAKQIANSTVLLKVIVTM